MGRPICDLTGKVFGRLTVLRILGEDDYKHRKYLCRCSCGTFTYVSGGDLKKPVGKGTLSCGCLRVDKSRKRPYEYIYNLLVRVAGGRGIPVLSYNEFLTFVDNKNCHYCERLITWNEHNITGKVTCRYNLDRKDNSLGYSKENCVVCCKECNMIKSDRFTYSQFVQIGTLLKKFREETL